MVRVAASTPAAAGPGATVPSERRAAQITPETPWPVVLVPRRCISGPTARPESTGAATTNQGPSAARAPVEAPNAAV